MKINGKNIEKYRKLHDTVETYGTTSVSYINEVCLMIDYIKPTSIIDYGCGKGTLIKALSELYPDINIIGYDPAIPGRDELPENLRCDMVINTDVLEHIPEEEIDETLKRIKGISNNVYFNLHHALADAVLSDGSNAHCTVRSPYWYYNKLNVYFDEITMLRGVESWQSVVCTFPITTDVWKKYDDMVEKKISIRKFYLRVKPLYDPLRPLILPLVKLIKKVFYGL